MARLAADLRELLVQVCRLVSILVVVPKLAQLSRCPPAPPPVHHTCPMRWARPWVCLHTLLPFIVNLSCRHPLPTQLDLIDVTVVGTSMGCAALRPPLSHRCTPDSQLPPSSLPTQLDLIDVTVVGASMGCAVIWSYIELFGEDRLKQVCYLGAAIWSYIQVLWSSG